MKKRKVTSIIVTYNSYTSGFFPVCLEDLFKTRLKNDLYEIEHSIIVVDSSSSDGTPQKVLADYPQIDVIASNENLGYAGGNNAGFHMALMNGTDYLAVVTHDITVEPDWLLEALDVAENDSSIGIVQPLTLLSNKPGLINTTGNHTHFLGYGYAGDYLKPLADYRNTDVRDIVYPSGACFLMPKHALQEVGDFDHEMWMYNEDQDLGWRMQMHGYRTVLAPKSKVGHKYEFSRSISKMYYMDRNRLLGVLQNYHWATLLLILPVLVLNEVAGLGFSLAGGWWREKLKTWRYFIQPQSWKRLLQKRRQRHQTRSVKDKDIVSKFTGKILFQDVMNPAVKYIGNPLLGTYWAVVKRIIFW